MMRFRTFIPVLIGFTLLLPACTLSAPTPGAGQSLATEPAPILAPEEPTPATSQALPAQVLDVAWQWTKLNDPSANARIDVPDPQKYTLTFRADGSVEVKADCNNLLGTYSTRGGGLTISLRPGTRAFCGETSLDQEYLELLSMITAGGPDSTGGLALETGGGAQRMEFVSETTATQDNGVEAILNIPWQWSALIEAEPAAQSVVTNPDNYTITFLPDGVFNFQADCNVGGGSYAVEGPAITLTLSPTTLAECGPDSQSDRYLQLLEQVDAHAAESNRLTLRLQKGAGEMQFSPGPAAAGPEPNDLVFYDDFTTDTGWFTSSGEDVSFELVNNGYQITNNLINAQIWSIRSVQPADIIQTVEAKHVEGPADGYYGVVCRQQEGGRDYYALVINSAGFYGIGIMLDGQFTFLTSGTDNQGIIDTQEGAFNQVRGDCIGETLTVYANSQLLASIKDTTYASGQIGMLASTRMDPGLVVLFDTYAVLTP